MDWTSYNQRAFEEKAKEFLRRQIKPQLMTALRAVAEQMIKTIDGAFQPWSIKPDGALPWGGTDDFPVWYGQMHDATGVGIYDNGALYQYLPAKKALDSQPQETETISNIIGSVYLEAALRDASSSFSRGIWIVLFSAVPYAYRINAEGSKWHRGKGFFDKLKLFLTEDVYTGLKPISKIS
jgi:hypothetical protein